MLKIGCIIVFAKVNGGNQEGYLYLFISITDIPYIMTMEVFFLLFNRFLTDA